MSFVGVCLHALFLSQLNLIPRVRTDYKLPTQITHTSALYLSIHRSLSFIHSHALIQHDMENSCLPWRTSSLRPPCATRPITPAPPSAFLSTFLPEGGERDICICIVRIPWVLVSSLTYDDSSIRFISLTLIHTRLRGCPFVYSFISLPFMHTY